MWVELVGITGTLFVLLSFSMKDLVKVRTINIVGAALFVIYGLLIGALSTWLLNGVLIMIHCAFLVRDYVNKRAKK